MNTYRTAEIVHSIGIHPNTVRLYEELGLIPKAERKANGYRIFTDFHVEQLTFARTALQVEVLQNGLRKQAIGIIKTSAAKNFDKAIHLTNHYHQQLKREQRNAEEAIAITEKLLSGENQQLSNAILTRKETANLLHISMDALRNWYQEKIKVSELCEVTASLYQSSKDYTTLLHQFGLSNKLKSHVSELSGGQKQRLFIVLALIPNPEVVFLDELTTGLDARARRDVWKSLADLKAKGLTILLTSHFMDEVEALCDRIMILKKGRSIFYGTVEEAIAASPYEKFEDAYLWYTDEEENNESI
ncbi:MerR family DNA-binding transcriptional regulator [Paenibacillus sp. 1001270B_150601_E10]|uniref:MerR family DNA-binding transcriptional regulator n=1 Tax=Paenibacillus sp. 1001270B_150601_E10 TaxID=2787079 RepID=UPI00189CDCCE|nr:MerR family DNA-binding transcriptional regulator [Paenibacillus sp. 1001270B_150601_E10]